MPKKKKYKNKEGKIYTLEEPTKKKPRKNINAQEEIEDEQEEPEDETTRKIGTKKIVKISKKLKSIMSQSKKRKKKKKTKIMERNIELIKHIEKNGIIYSSNVKDSDKKRLYSYNKNSKNCRKFMENPQQFFTEDLCDVMLLQYDIYPKEHLNNSCMKTKKKKIKKMKKIMKMKKIKRIIKLKKRNFL